MPLFARFFLLSLAVATLDAAPGLTTGSDRTEGPVISADPAVGIAMAEHAEEVASYTLTARLDPKSHTVQGEGTIRWRNTSSAPVSELWVHLYLNAFKNDKSVFLRERVGEFRGGELPSDWGMIDVQRLALRDAADGTKTELWPRAELHRPGDPDETDVRVPLPRPIAPGQAVMLDVAWDSKLPSVVMRTGYAGSFHLIGQWFPKLARLEPDGHWAHFPFHRLAEFYADFGTYDVTLDVPEEFTLGATGPVVEARLEGGRRIERHVQADVHDFAWTAWDRWDRRTESVGGVDVTCLYPRGFGRVAERELATVRFALPHFGSLYGRYPYRILTLVHPPENAAEAGGMEYPTFITTGAPWYAPAGYSVPELMTMHEFGHQYFYGLVASNEARWPFLDEGLNTYAEAEALGAFRGPGSALDVAGLEVSDAAFQAATSATAAHRAPVAQPASAFGTGSDYGLLVYNRTAVILETLRRVYGRERFERALGTYTRRFRFAHPKPDDLLAVFGETMGARATETLRAALFEQGWVDFRIERVSSSKEQEPTGVFDHDGMRETLPAGRVVGDRYAGSILVRREGTLGFPVDIELTREGGATERVRWEGDARFVELPYRGSAPLVGAVVDPDHAVLIDQNLTNNHASAVGRRGGGAPRTLERALYWTALFAQAVSP